MIENQILEAIKQMPNVERLKIIEFTLRLVREEMEKNDKLSLKDAAEMMRPYYVEGSDLTEFVDVNYEDFYEYQDLETTFNQLAEQWRRETRGVSSTEQLSMHSAYQQIIGMGGDAIPMLLRELERKSGHWFWALKSITREDPVTPEQRGKIKEMIEAWLDWGRKKGYIW